MHEKHLYLEVENREDYTEHNPVITDDLVMVPAQIYVCRIVSHKLVMKSILQIEDPERNAFELAPLPVILLPKCMASESMLVDSCKSLGIDPREWMEDVLLRIPGNELLPDRWAK